MTTTRVLVTGASGHIGGHVARACLGRGWAVTALHRPTSDLRGLHGLDVERCVGDVLDAASVERAARGAELVFHVASIHRNHAPDPAELARTAVEGTRTVLDAARRAGARRAVVTSSGAAVGFAADPAKPLDEGSFLEHAQSPYTQSKIDAEAEARRQAALGGLEVVVCNPSGVFGPRDYRITPATAALVGLLQGDPAFLHICPTDVRDVAEGHVLAALHGAPGERYILTGDAASPARLRELLQRLAGVAPPLFRPPRFLLRWLAGRQERLAARTGKDASITRAQVDDVYGRHLVYDSTRARRELGVTFRPDEAVLRDAFRWLLFIEALAPKVAEKVRVALGPAAAPDADWTR